MQNIHENKKHSIYIINYHKRKDENTYIGCRHFHLCLKEFLTWYMWYKTWSINSQGITK